jgi:uncharacterized protein YjdB
VALWGAPACRNLTIDESRVIAIEVAVTAPTVQAGDTLRLAARLLNAAGSVVPGTQVTWVADDTITGFTLNKNTGLVTAVAAGTWKVWARFEKLQSDALTLTVTP